MRALNFKIQFAGFLCALSLFLTANAEARSYIPNDYRRSDATGSIELDWLMSDTAKEIDVACNTPAFLSDAKLLEKINAYRSNEFVSRVVDGVEFAEADSALLRALEVLLIRPDSDSVSVLPQKIGPITGKKFDIVATAQTVFGKRIGLQLLYLFLHHRVNASHYQQNKTSPWQENELDSILNTLADLPPHLQIFPLSPSERSRGFQVMVHAPRAKILKTKKLTVLADSQLKFYDAWTSTDAFARRATALHEIGHNIQFEMKDRQPWINLSPWPLALTKEELVDGKMVPITQEINSTFAKNYLEPFVSEYAKTSPSEDFAESFTAYRYAPKWLKERNPDKYEYMKNVVFDGIEYLEESICRVGKESHTPKYKKLIATEFVQYEALLANASIPKYLNPATEKMQRECDLDFARDILFYTSQSVHQIHDNCTRRVLDKNFIDLTDQILGPTYAENIRAVLRAVEPENSFTPKLSINAVRNGAKNVLAEIREAILVDMADYLKAPERDLRSCSDFAAHFLNWSFMRREKSALFTRGTFTQSSETSAYRAVIKASCKPYARTTALAGKPAGSVAITLKDFQSGLEKSWERVSPNQ